MSKAVSPDFENASQPHIIKIPKKYQLLWTSFQSLLPEKESDNTKAKIAFVNLAKRYNEPHRRHHTLTHISDLLSQYHHYEHLLGDDSKPVLAALFYHDIVYNCQHRQDEQESARYAEEDLANLGVSKEIIARTKSIILATADHKTDERDSAVQLFLDIDMSVLASRPDMYAHYLANTRYEYCTKLNIAESDFHHARAERFLKPILSGDTSLFKSSQYAHLNPVAKLNLQRELESYAPQLPVPPTLSV